MTLSASRFISLFTLAVMLSAVASGCANKWENSYGPSLDDQAMNHIESVWTGEGVTVTLCEANVPADQTYLLTNGCELEHWVRGDGLGAVHREEHRGGRGTMGTDGCNSHVSAYVSVTMEGEGFTEPSTTEVWVEVGSGWSEDPYSMPFLLHHVDAPEYSATLDADGLFLSLLDQDGTELFRTLTRVGDANCPDLD